MAWQRKSPAKGRRTVKRKLADNTVKTYTYAKYTPKVRDTGDTVEGLIEAYKRSPEWSALSPKTRAVRLTYFKRLEGTNDAGVSPGSMAVVAIKRRDIMAIRDGVIAGHGRGAANGFLKASCALFRWAVDREWIEHSPAEKIRHSPGGHLRPWTRQEADAANDGLPEQLRRAVVLARHTGQRRGDLCAMLWSAYDGTSLRVTQEKSKPGLEPVSLVIPCSAALRAELDVWKQEATTLTILANSKGRPWLTAGLSKYLPWAMKKIGLPPLGIHGLRKLAATELAQAGCSTQQIMAITGHTTLAMVELYTKSVEQERLAGSAVIQLEAFQKKRIAE